MKSLEIAWYWERVSASYWFVPSLMTLGAAGLAVGLGELDERMTDKFVEEAVWLWKGGAEGARTLLGAVATATVTAASTVFSITIVALTLAANQFGPRLLRGFMRDRGNQLVLGAFLATFVYCLLVLRSVRDVDDTSFVPHLSISVAIALALVSVGVLIYFIHHVSTSIHVDEVIASAGEEFERTLASLARHAGSDVGESRPAGAGAALCATCSGYLQVIDEDSALAVLAARDLVMRASVRPGEFVLRGAELARVWPPAALDDEAAAALREAFVLSGQRTPLQDPGFAVDALVEIGVRALSPGINDPFTAISCLDWLCDALCKLAALRLPDELRRDAGGRVRLVRRPLALADVVDLAFDPLRRSAAADVTVSLRMMERIEALCRQLDDPRACEALRGQAEMIERASRAWPEPRDRQRLLARYHRVVAAPPADPPPAA